MGDDLANMELNTLAIWIQVHDLPSGFMSKSITELIERKLGTFIESGLNNYNEP